MVQADIVAAGNEITKNSTDNLRNRLIEFSTGLFTGASIGGSVSIMSAYFAFLASLFNMSREFGVGPIFNSSVLGGVGTFVSGAFFAILADGIAIMTTGKSLLTKKSWDDRGLEYDDLEELDHLAPRAPIAKGMGVALPLIVGAAIGFPIYQEAKYTHDVESHQQAVGMKQPVPAPKDSYYIGYVVRRGDRLAYEGRPLCPQQVVRLYKTIHQPLRLGS